ncbi:MAG: hypothetical protein MJZ74_10560 [Muribaculaceae bacterium]|nr:hypothetical protein [Muribaculaceae bacterium]
MKRKFSQLVVVPRCARHYRDGEAAVAGEAAVVKNLRERECSLEVVGVPVPCGSIPAGHRLMLVDGDRYFTLCDNRIYCNGSVVLSADSEVLAMHRMGDGVVAVTRRGLRHLQYDGEACVEVDLHDAIPAIEIVVGEDITSQQSMDEYAFAHGYSRWNAPLDASDVAALTSRYRMAWSVANASIVAQGGYNAPLMACYGVRLRDDNYLWVSEPVFLGESTTGNAQQVSAQVMTDGGRYTGIEASTLSLQGFKLGLRVTAGVGQRWRHLVKAVDVFVTRTAAVADTTSLVYRCVNTQAGQRVSLLQFGWQSVPASSIRALLEASGWTMVASTGSIEALDGGRFEAANVVYAASTSTGIINAPMWHGASLSRDDVERINTRLDAVSPVASLVRNGRLYVASGDGQLALMAHGNAMSVTQVSRVTGTSIMALAPVSRPLYSGGFGRYAVYLFTDEGIYAVAQSATGVLGEARLVDRSVIAPGCVPVDGDRDVYYVDSHDWVCRLTGSAVTRLVPLSCKVTGMTWDAAHHELHVITEQGDVLAMSREGHHGLRTIEASGLYDDVTRSLAVTPTGQVLDLATEQSARLPVEYMSHPIVLDRAMCASPSGVTWCVMGQDLDVSLALHGDRGMTCHGFLVGRLRVRGDANAPLHMPLRSPLCRSVRLKIDGEAMTGTVISSTTIK